MISRRPALLLLSLTALAASGCGSGEVSWPDHGPRVVVTFGPLDSFARKVLGDHGAVHCLCEGPNNDVTDFEPSREDAAELREADVLFANGLGLDDGFVDTLRVNSNNANLRVVPLGDLVPKDQRIKNAAGAADPHVWLGLTQAVAMVHGVRDGLKEADPGNAADYDANAEKYVGELKDLLKEGRDAVAKVREQDRKLVALHDSLRYFAADLGVDVAGAVETEPGVEPSPRRYDRIAELCKKDHVRLIAVPKAYSKESTAKILDELKKRDAGEVRLVVIDPLETADDLKSPDWYQNKMKQNIDALAEAWAK